MTHKVCYKIMQFKVVKITLICPHTSLYIFVRLQNCLHQVYSYKPLLKQQVSVIELQCIGVVKLGQHFTKP